MEGFRGGAVGCWLLAGVMKTPGMADNFSAGFCSFAECLLSACGVRLDLGFSSGPSFRPERARLSEERIFDLSRSLFEVRRFLQASARRAGIQALASFRERGEAECSGPELLESRRSFPGHRRSCPVKMPQLAVRRFSAPSAAAPPGLERKPGFRLSARAFKCDAAGFQRTLALARNEAPDSGNARSGRNDGARKYLSRPRKAGTNFGRNFIPKTGWFSSPQLLAVSR